MLGPVSAQGALCESLSEAMQGAVMFSMPDRVSLSERQSVMQLTPAGPYDNVCPRPQGEGALGSLAKFASTFSTELAEKIDPNY